MAQNNNSNLEKGDYSKVIDILTNMFGEVMDSDAIFAVVDSCDGELTNSIEAVMKIMEETENKPQDKSDNTTSGSVPSSTSQIPVNISTTPEMRPITSYANASSSSHSGAIPKTRISPNPEIPRQDWFWTDQTKRVIDYHNKCYRTFIILRGAPGSGKSHLAREIVEKTIGPGEAKYRTHVFSSDDFFSVRGRYHYDRNRLSEAHEWNQKRSREAFKRGISPVILDNTNIELWETKPYVIAAVKEGYLIELIEPNTPWSRTPGQLYRRNVHEVPLNSIKRMLENFKSRGITGNELIQSMGIYYPLDKIPPIPRAIPADRFCQNQDTRNDKGQNAHKTLISYLVPAPNTTRSSSNEITSATSSHAIVDKRQRIVPISREESVLEKTAKERDIGRDWEENRQDTACSTKNLSDEPKAQRQWKGTPSVAPLLPDVPEGQDWSTLTQFMPAWQAVLPPSTSKADVAPVESKTTATCVEIGDTDIYSVNNKHKVLNVSPRDINIDYMPKEEKIPVIRKLDKSSSTNDQLIAETSRCANEEKHFIAFRKLFKHISRDDLRHLFDSCRGDVNWAVGLVLDGVSDNSLNVNDDAELSESDEVGDEQCECTAAYFIRPDSKLASLTVKECTIEEADLESTANYIQKKNRKDKAVSEASMQLKKEIEQNIVIGDSHYSNHCLMIKKLRRGELVDDSLPVEYTPEAGSSQAVDIPTVKRENEPNKSSFEESPTNDDVSECSDDVEETVNFNLGSEFIKHLDNMFGRKDMKYPENIMSIINIPTSTLNELNALWMESCSYQVALQSSYSEILVKQDEEFARQLSEREAEMLRIGREPEVPDFKEIMDLDLALNIHHKQLAELMRSNEPNDLAARMTRDKLNNLFPDVPPDTLSEMLMAHDNNFQSTVEVLLMSTGQADVLEEKNGLNKYVMKKELERQEKLLEEKKNEELTETEWPMLSDATEVDMSTVDEYRREAKAHLEMRNVQYQKSLSYMRRGMTTAAAHCSQLARWEKSQFEQSNLRAAVALIKYNSRDKSNTTLDLHHLFVPEAMESLDIFVDHHISMLKDENRPKKTLYLITGRGAHSPGGPKIKPSVRRRLRARGYRVTEVNPGLLSIDITKEDKLTYQLRK